MLHDAARALLAAGYETAKDPQPTADAYPAGSRTAYRRAQKKREAVGFSAAKRRDTALSAVVSSELRFPLILRPTAIKIDAPALILCYTRRRTKAAPQR